MEHSEQFQAIFGQLKRILEPFGERLSVEADTAENYSLNTPYVEQWKKPLFFGAVQIKKNYVSYHLMPVYMFPALLDGVSPQLTRRMQGKSCFSFTKLDPTLAVELADLTARGFEALQREYQI